MSSGRISSINKFGGNMFHTIKSYFFGAVAIFAVIYFLYEGKHKLDNMFGKIIKTEKEEIAKEDKKIIDFIETSENILVNNEDKKIPSTQEIESIVKNYILQNPEIISDALDKLQQIRMEELKKKVQEKIAEKKDQLESNSSAYIGNVNGKTIIVMFYDYNCGYCKQSYDAVSALVHSNPEVKVILKPYPILGAESEFLAKLTTALFIKNPAKFQVIHEELLSDKIYNKEELANLFKEHGINFSEIETFGDSEEVTNMLKENFLLARELKINGVPAFVINGIYHPGHLTIEQLSEKIAIPANLETHEETNHVEDHELDQKVVEKNQEEKPQEEKPSNKAN